MLSHCTPEKHLRTTTPKLYAQSSHEPGTTSTYTYNTTIQSMTATIGANIAATMTTKCRLSTWNLRSTSHKPNLLKYNTRISTVSAE